MNPGATVSVPEDGAPQSGESAGLPTMAAGAPGQPDMRQRFMNMSEEEREQMRERFRNMSPEERERMRQQLGGGREGEGGRGGEGRGGRGAR